MKPFNLDEYLKNPSREIVTRDGRKVTRILCTDVKSAYPIVAVIENCNSTEEVNTLTKNGKHLDADNCPHKNDLFFAPKKYEGWINIFKSSNDIVFLGQSRIFESKEDAEKSGKGSDSYAATIKIEWEEDE